MIKSFCDLCHRECKLYPPKTVRSIRMNEVNIPVVIQLQCGNMCDECWKRLLAILLDANKASG